MSGHSTGFATWYAAAMEEAEDRFSPLSLALAELLEVKPVVDQTGGMTMLLRVPVGRDDKRWVWFSEMGENDSPGFGCYAVDDEDEFIEPWDGCNGDTYVTHPYWICPPGEWRDHPEFSLLVAEWAAPLIVDFATRTAAL